MKPREDIPQVPGGLADPGEAALQFMQMTARLLLENSTRAEVLKRQIDRLAKHFRTSILTLIGYRDVTLLTADHRSFHAQIPELRLNVAVASGMLRVIDDLCADHIGLDEAKRRLQIVESTPPHHPRWLLVLIFGLAASALPGCSAQTGALLQRSGASAGVGLMGNESRSSRRAHPRPLRHQPRRRARVVREDHRSPRPRARPGARPLDAKR